MPIINGMAIAKQRTIAVNIFLWRGRRITLRKRFKVKAFDLCQFWKDEVSSAVLYTYSRPSTVSLLNYYMYM